VLNRLQKLVETGIPANASISERRRYSLGNAAPLICIVIKLSLFVPYLLLGDLAIGQQVLVDAISCFFYLIGFAFLTNNHRVTGSLITAATATFAIAGGAFVLGINSDIQLYAFAYCAGSWLLFRTTHPSFPHVIAVLGLIFFLTAQIYAPSDPMWAPKIEPSHLTMLKTIHMLSAYVAVFVFVYYLSHSGERAEELQRIHFQKNISAMLQEKEDKESFTDRMIHEAHKPISILDLQVQSLDIESHAPSLRSTVENIRKTLRNLSDLLYTSFIQLQLLSVATLRPQKTDLSMLLNVIATSVQAKSENNEIRMGDTRSPEMVVCDPRLIGIAVTDALTVALEHSPPEALIHVSTREAQSDQIEIMITLEGDGISSQQIQSLFDQPKFIADESSTKAGLYIAAKIAHLHGGIVSCDTIPCMGTAIKLTIQNDVMPNEGD